MKEGWQIKRLGEICEIARGGSPRPIQSYLTDDPNGVNWIKIGDTEVGGKYICSTKERIKREGIRSSRYVEVGDFLLSNSMSFGRPYILKVDGCIHDGWLVIKNYENTFIQDFLYYLLLSPNVVKQFEEGARGSTVRNLNTNIVSQTSVIVPSLSEQQRIVALLDAEFAKIDVLKANAEKNLQNAKELFQAALKKELEPKEGWNEKKIGELFETGSGGTPLKMHKEYYEGGNIPWLRSGEVCKKYITETELFITKLGLDNSSAKYFPSNTIVVAMYGATAGQVGILKIQTTTNQAVCGIFPNELYIPEFVYYSIQSKQENLVSQATGNAQPNISQIKIKNLSIPILPLSDQQSIVARLDTLDEKCKVLQANYEKTLSLCDDLKQALLRKAFNGEI